MSPFWLMRMKRWAQRPPSGRQVRFGLVVVAICLALYAAEQVWGWPDWLTPERVPGTRVLR